MGEGRLFPRYVYDVDPRADVVKTAVSYDAGYIVLSFFTSAVGCITTLELLKRRTSTRGGYNWYFVLLPIDVANLLKVVDRFLLLASAITMGGIGIWGMHFVANRAVILENGVPARQILYNSAYTAISFFLPILVLLAAFYMLGIPDRAHPLHVALGGVLTGTAVCGMHYVGQLGIENYRCSYQVQNVVGAAVIAVVDSLIALSVFFRLRDAWTDGWWKRILCGAILSLAVSGMHWTAAVGTIYEWKGNSAVHGKSRMQASIIASSLVSEPSTVGRALTGSKSIGSCIVLLIIAIISGRNILHTKVKAQSLVLACTYFDEDGRLMVTQEGTLPSEKITNHYIETVS
jgi:NO-binding membrane sensor protein with MHYT domain